jgi:hypothetical protein
MDDSIDEILKRLPTRPPRSRLDPHAELINELRRHGRTYREIACLLMEVCQVRTSPSNIYYFVKIRAKEAKRGKARRAGRNEAALPGTDEVASAQFRQLPTDVAHRIAVLKQRKPSSEGSSVGFPFDPDEPLRLITTQTPLAKK